MSNRVSRMKENAHALVAVGVVVVVAAVVVGVPVFGPSPYALVPLLLGALLTAAGAALAPAARASVAPRRLLWRALPIAVVAVSWGAASQLGLERDVTAAQTNTLADESVRVARAVKAPVRIVSFIAAGERADVELRALVERYVAENAVISFEARDAKRGADAGVAAALGVADLLPLGGPNVVVLGTAAPDEDPPRVALRVDAGLVNLEEQLTNALAQVASHKTRARVYVTTGHGEPDVRDEGAFGLARLAVFARERGIDLVPLPFAVLQQHGVPDDARALWVLPAKSAMFLNEEPALVRAADALPTWVAVDKDAVAPAAATLAGAAGVTVVDDLVVDESGFGSVFGADTLTGSSQMAHPITRTLAGALTHFTRVATLAVAAVDGVDVVPVVSSSGDAVSVTNHARGPLPILVAATQPTQPTQPAHPKPEGWGRRLVSGDVSFCTNAGIGLGANKDLALNALLWLVADDDAITVRPREKTGALLFLTPSARTRLTFFLVFVLPVTLASVAAASAARRRS